MDKPDKKGCFIVTDTDIIHHAPFVVVTVNKRSYKPLFILPYSLFLNLIEKC